MLTIAAFKERVDETTLIELTDPTLTAVNDTMVERALQDAWHEIEGYTYQLGEGVPPAEVLEAHQFNITMYQLAGNRPGVEYDSFAKRYQATIRYLERLRPEVAGVNASGAEREAFMDGDSLAAFADLRVPQ